MSHPRVSIVIVTYNALPLLQRCLPSVVATDYPNLEIILADNASTDGSAEWVRAEYPEVKVVRHPENWLFCRGNNEAITEATGEFILLLNNDVEVPPEWLHPLVNEMQRNRRIGAVQPKLLQFDDRNRFEYAGAAGGFIDRIGYPFTRGRIFDVMEEDRGQYDRPTDVFWASGAAVLLRRSALDEVGLLDERFEMHMEEIDLCWRLHSNGYRVRVQPESEVYHLGGSSLPKGSYQKVYYNFRNSLLTLYKNLSASSWRVIFPQRVAFDMAASARFASQGEFEKVKAVMAAYRDAHQLKDTYANARMSIGQEVKPSYRGFIAVEHYLRGVKSFSELPKWRFRSFFLDAACSDGGGEV